MERDRDQFRITINHFELKKESKENDNFLKEEMLSDMTKLPDECLTDLESSRGEITEEPQRTGCGSCLLFLVKCLDLLINISIIGLNYLNFTIRNIWNVQFAVILNYWYQNNIWI